MQNIFTNKGLHLASGEATALRVNGRICVKVLRGRVWVTMQGNAADYWLTSGQQIDIPGYGMLVIEAACGDSQLRASLPQRQWQRSLATVAERIGSVQTAVTVPLLLLLCISLLRLRQ